MNRPGRAVLAAIAILALIVALLVGLRLWYNSRTLPITIRNTGALPIMVVRGSLPGLDVKRSINDSWNAEPGGEVLVPRKRAEDLIVVALDGKKINSQLLHVSPGVKRVDVSVNPDGTFSFTEH
jgi:hypothetical protein